MGGWDLQVEWGKLPGERRGGREKQITGNVQKKAEKPNIFHLRKCLSHAHDMPINKTKAMLSGVASFSSAWVEEPRYIPCIFRTGKGRGEDIFR